MSIILSEFIFPGLFIGLVAAVSPGPLMALLLSETLRSGKWAGIKVALSPIITDIPFVIIAIGVSKVIEAVPGFLGVISIAGGCFLGYLAYQNIRVQPGAFSHEVSGSHSLLKGIVVNLFNPFPYLFWFSVAIPIFAKGNTVGSILFAASLLIAAPLTMMLIALLASYLRDRFTSHLHWIVRILGIFLFLYAFQLLYKGIFLL